MRVLGVGDRALFEEWKARARSHEATAIQVEVLLRIGSVLSIYGSLVTLLSHERSSDWIHAPNSAFAGKSALDVITGGQLEDLDRVARYLLAQVHG